MIYGFLRRFYTQGRMIGLRARYMNYTKTYINDLTIAQKACPELAKIKDSSILVTGATGLICSSIVDFLMNLNDTVGSNIKIYIAARNYEKVQKRFGKHINRSDIVFVKYDALQDFKEDIEVDYIIHGASPANPSLYIKQPVETMLANILGMNNVLKYAVNHSTKRVLFISSSEVYGKKNDSNPYKDSEYGFVDILNPRACYPSAKRACETLCVSYEAEYMVDSVVVRPGHIYGPTASRDDNRVSSQFFYDVLDEKDLVMKSSGSQIRSYCYVIDCVTAIISVLVNGKTGNAYNISNPSSVVTIRDLAEKIATCGKRKVIFENPSDIEKVAFNLMDNSSLDSTSLLELGWEPMFDSDTGVRHTYDIMKGY